MYLLKRLSAEPIYTTTCHIEENTHLLLAFGSWYSWGQVICEPLWGSHWDVFQSGLSTILRVATFNSNALNYDVVSPCEECDTPMRFRFTIYIMRK